ncbi:MAG TPA: hypothetical protein VFV38_20910, partial [Ktedonobacteraceae bacterium]|nr:hypothetical protein [Ktedonobacteraceae bacterium]
LPINQDQLQHLIAALLVYRLYLLRKALSTEERTHLLSVLKSLLQKLQFGLNSRAELLPLVLTEDDVSVITAGLTTLLEQLQNRKPSEEIHREMQQLQEIKTSIEQTFNIVQH